MEESEPSTAEATLLPARRSSSKPCPPHVQASRRQLEQLVSGPIATLDEVDVQLISEEGVGGIVCTPSATPITAEVLWFHGGGYRVGHPAFSLPIAHRLATAGARVTIPRYALAPEAPFPNAIHDALAALAHVRRRDVGPIVIGGESAGGGLAAAAVLSGQRVDGLLLLSPWLDLSVTAESYSRNAAADAVFSTHQAAEAADLYLQGHPADHPLASPALGDAEMFPPTGIVVGTDEVLLDDALAMATRLGCAGVSVELHVIAGLAHVGPLLEPDMAPSRAALQSLISSLQRMIAAPSISDDPSN